MSIHVTFSFCFLEAMPQRLCPDPTVGVRDLQQPISNWLKESGSYDLYKLLQPKNAVSWKTAADCEWLCQLSPLLLKLLRVDGKCCFASKKIKGALQKIHTGSTFQSTMTTPSTICVTCGSDRPAVSSGAWSSSHVRWPDAWKKPPFKKLRL